VDYLLENVSINPIQQPLCHS